MMKSRNACKIFTGNMRTAFRKPRHRQKDNIKTDIRKRKLQNVNWMHLARIGTNGGFL
jgi:hypothetical protein